MKSSYPFTYANKCVFQESFGMIGTHVQRCGLCIGTYASLHIIYFLQNLSLCIS
jgi:hypothetical protein